MELRIMAAMRREQNKALLRRKIIDAARALISNEQLSMRALALAAGVSSKTPYRLFGSKQVLLATMFEEDFAGFNALIDARHVGDSLDKFYLVIDLAAEVYEQDARFYRDVLSATYLSANSVMKDIFETQRFAGWEAIVCEAMDEGLLQRRTHSATVAKIILHIFIGTALDWVRGKIDTEQMRLEISLGVTLTLATLATPVSAPRLRLRQDQFSRHFANPGVRGALRSAGS
jgi:AcrR family transcriptional regulator